MPVPGLIAEVLDDHVNRYGLASYADTFVFSAERGGRLNLPAIASLFSYRAYWHIGRA